MTDVEVLKNSIDRLNQIPVPVEHIEDIGIPLYNVKGNLTALLNAVIRQTMEAAKPQQQEDPNVTFTKESTEAEPEK